MIIISSVKLSLIRLINSLYLNEFIEFNELLAKKINKFINLFKKEGIRIKKNLLNTSQIDKYIKYLVDGILNFIILYINK